MYGIIRVNKKRRRPRLVDERTPQNVGRSRRAPDTPVRVPNAPPLRTRYFGYLWFCATVKIIHADKYTHTGTRRQIIRCAEDPGGAERAAGARTLVVGHNAAGAIPYGINEYNKKKNKIKIGEDKNSGGVVVDEPPPPPLRCCGL